MQTRLEIALVTAQEKISRQEIELGSQEKERDLLETRIHAMEKNALQASAVRAELAEAKQQLEQMAARVSQSSEQEQLKERVRTLQANNQAQQVRDGMKPSIEAVICVCARVCLCAYAAHCR